MNDPIPQAVKSQVHAHSMVMPDHDGEQAQATFWAGMREVLREEMTELLNERERRD